EAEEAAHVRIHGGARPARVVIDEVIERALPAQGALDDLGGERAIALVPQLLAALRQRRREVDLPRLDRAQRTERRGARRGGHRAVNAVPGGSGWPARYSRART